ncbi:MAG TPA: FlgO family outer membrane protein [Thermoanaerobaculia bacterium]|nr:FlgO family outer membrane protein [Thermoanaerobaculia bacterium]
MQARIRVLALVLLGFTLAFLSPDAARGQDFKSAVEQLARDLGNSVPEGRTLTVAVSDFPDLQGGVTDLGRYVSERLVTRLSARPEKFRVIERRRLDQVLSELRFNLSDLVDPAKAQQLGKMLGVQAIVVGTLSDLGTNIDIDARIIDIGVNSTMPGVSVTLSKDDTVRQLLERGRQMPGYGGGSSAGGSSSMPAPSSVLGFYESPEIRIEVDSLRVLKNDEIIMTAYFSSSRSSGVTVALNDGGHGSWRYYPTYLVDELGQNFRLEKVSALRGNPLFLPPGTRVLTTLTFDADYRGLGESVSLATDVDIFSADERGTAGKHLKTLNIWIRNMKPSK